MRRPEVAGVVPVVEAAIPVSPARGPVVAVALAVAGMPRLVLVPNGMRVIPRRVPVRIVLVIVLVAICIVLVIALIIIVARRIVLVRLILPRCCLTRRGMR